MSALTIRSLIPDYDPDDWIRHDFVDSQAGRALTRYVPSVGKDAVANLLADQVEKALEMNLIELLVQAWLRHDQLSKLAENTGEGELVELVDHRLTSSHAPEVEVVLNGKTIATISLKLTLELEFSGVQLLLQGGQVREVRVGELDAAGSVVLEGHQLVRQPLTHVDLPGTIKLEPGVSLH